jgi:hypothetical protein
MTPAQKYIWGGVAIIVIGIAVWLYGDNLAGAI